MRRTSGVDPLCDQCPTSQQDFATIFDELLKAVLKGCIDHPSRSVVGPNVTNNSMHSETRFFFAAKNGCITFYEKCGTKIIRQFIDTVVLPNSNVTSIVVDPEEGNSRSLRAFEKAGFTPSKTVKLQGEDFRRVVMRWEAGDR